jgi:hypothetical protein
MKLLNIYEAAGSISSGGTPVLNISQIFGQLIDILFNDDRYKDSEPAKLLRSYFKTPSSDTWSTISDDFISGFLKILDSDKENANKYKDLKKSMTELKTYAPSIITSALYAIEPRYLLKTDLKSLAQSTQDTAKTMLALQPSGWVAMLSNTDGVSKSQLKEVRKKISDEGKKISQDVTKNFPGATLKKKF